MAPRPPPAPRLLPLLAAAAALHVAAGDAAAGGTGGESRLQLIASRLTELGREAQVRQQVLTSLEALRTGLLTGERVELPSAQRQHLETGSPLIGEVTFDARHRAISTDVGRHFQHVRTVASDVTVKLYTLMPLKRVTSGASKAPGPASLLLVVDDQGKLSAFDPESSGSELMSSFDLGHAPGRPVTHMATASTQESGHILLTADAAGELRAHSLRIVARRENRTAVTSGERPALETSSQRLNITMNFTCSFSLPKVGVRGALELEQPKLTSILPVERGERIFFATGDSLGGISVFFSNGTLKGRVRVTEDLGGVRGLLKGQSQLTVFFSSHSFGSFSVSQIDVLNPPCTGWNSPVYDVVLDPSFQSSRVILSLVDGDVLVFTTTRGKSKVCDLTNKFPHVSTVPFKLQNFRGHIMALASPLAEDPRAAEYLREVYFFNLEAMDAGYGASPSRTVTLQASFKPKQPDDVALSTMLGAGGQVDRTKALAGLRFINTTGIHLYSLSLRLPVAVQTAALGNVIEDEWEEHTWWDFFTTGWFPKMCVFGMALIGVVIWNLRKSSEGWFGGGGPDEFDEEFFKEQLRKARVSEAPRK